MGILSILLNNKWLIIGAVLLAIIGGEYLYIQNLSSRNDALAAEKVTLQVQLTESQANVKQLQNDIIRQNSAIDQLKKDADIRLAKNAADVKAAQAIADTHKSHAEELLKKIVPQDMSKCDAANLIINEEIKNVRK